MMNDPVKLDYGKPMRRRKRVLGLSCNGWFFASISIALLFVLGGIATNGRIAANITAYTLEIALFCFAVVNTIRTW